MYGYEMWYNSSLSLSPRDDDDEVGTVRERTICDRRSLCGGNAGKFVSHQKKIAKKLQNYFFVAPQVKTNRQTRKKKKKKKKREKRSSHQPPRGREREREKKAHLPSHKHNINKQRHEL